MTAGWAESDSLSLASRRILSAWNWRTWSFKFVSWSSSSLGAGGAGLEGKAKVALRDFPSPAASPSGAAGLETASGAGAAELGTLEEAASILEPGEGRRKLTGLLFQSG